MNPLKPNLWMIDWLIWTWMRRFSVFTNSAGLSSYFGMAVSFVWFPHHPPQDRPCQQHQAKVETGFAGRSLRSTIYQCSTRTLMFTVPDLTPDHLTARLSSVQGLVADENKRF